MATKTKSKINRFNELDPSYKCFFEDFNFPSEVIKQIFSELKPEIPAYEQIKFHRKLRECQRILIFGNNGKPDYPLFLTKNVELLVRFYDCILKAELEKEGGKKNSLIKSVIPHNSKFLDDSLKNVNGVLFADIFVESLKSHSESLDVSRYSDFAKSYLKCKIFQRCDYEVTKQTLVTQVFGSFTDSLGRFADSYSPFFFGLLGMDGIVPDVAKVGFCGPKNWMFPSEEVDTINSYGLPLITTLPYYLYKPGVTHSSRISEEDYPITLCDSVVQLEKLLTVRRKLKPLIILGMVNTSFRKFVYSSNVMKDFWDESLSIIHGTKLGSPSHFKFNLKPIFNTWDVKNEIQKYKDFDEGIKKNNKTSEMVDEELSLVGDIKIIYPSDNNNTKSNSLEDIQDYEYEKVERQKFLERFFIKTSCPFSFFRASDLVPNSDIHQDISNKKSNSKKREHVRFLVKKIFESHGTLLPLPVQSLLSSDPKGFASYMSSFLSHGKIEDTYNTVCSNYKLAKNILSDLYCYNEGDGNTRLDLSAQMFHNIEQDIIKMNSPISPSNGDTEYTTKIRNFSGNHKVSMVMTFLNFPMFINTIPPWIVEKFNLFSHYNLCNRFTESNTTEDSKFMKMDDKNREIKYSNEHFTAIPNYIPFIGQCKSTRFLVRIKTNGSSKTDSTIPSFMLSGYKSEQMTNNTKFDIDYLNLHDLRTSTELYKIATVYFKTGLCKDSEFYSYDNFKKKYFENFFVKLQNYEVYFQNMSRFHTEIYKTYSDNIKSVILAFQPYVIDTTMNKHIDELEKVDKYLLKIHDKISCIHFYTKIFGYQTIKFVKTESINKDEEKESEKQESQKKFKKQPSDVSQKTQIVEMEKELPSKKKRKSDQIDDFGNDESSDMEGDNISNPKKKRKTTKIVDDIGHNKKDKSNNVTKKEIGKKQTVDDQKRKEIPTKKSKTNKNKSNDKTKSSVDLNLDEFDFETQDELDKYSYQNTSSKLPKSKHFF